MTRNQRQTARNLTIREIKMAICAHEKLAPAATSEQQPDGRYVEMEFHGGVVQPASLPGVSIDLEALFP